MAGRRTFRILTYSQLSDIEVKAVIRPKYSNLYIVMIQCTHYKNYCTFKASNYNTHKSNSKPTTCDKDILHKTVLSPPPPGTAFTHSPHPITFRLFTKRVNASHPDHFEYLTLHHAYTSFHFTTLDDHHCTPPSSLIYTVILHYAFWLSLHKATLHFLVFTSLHFT
jgi:hypothetical protein